MTLFVFGSLAIALGSTWRLAQLWSDHRLRARSVAALIAASREEGG
jgi:hypothetical protein